LRERCLARFEDKGLIECRRRASIQCAINLDVFDLGQCLSNLGLGNTDVAVTQSSVVVDIIAEIIIGYRLARLSLYGRYVIAIDKTATVVMLTGIRAIA
jgi:hypothetical protein